MIIELRHSGLIKTGNFFQIFPGSRSIDDSLIGITFNDEMPGRNDIVPNTSNLLGAQVWNFANIEFINLRDALYITCRCEAIHDVFSTFHFANKIGSVVVDLDDFDTSFRMPVAKHKPSFRHVNNHIVLN